MRKFFSVFLPLLGVLAAPAQAGDRHVFDGPLVAVFGKTLIFNHPVRGIEVVPLADLDISWENGGFIFKMKGLAETSAFEKFLGRGVTIFTLSGNGEHPQVFGAIANAVVNLIEGNLSAMAPPPVLRAKWKDADNIEHEVEVAKQPNESMKDHVKRYADYVAAMKMVFPPAKGTP